MISTTLDHVQVSRPNRCDSGHWQVVVRWNEMGRFGPIQRERIYGIQIRQKESWEFSLHDYTTWFTGYATQQEALREARETARAWHSYHRARTGGQ